jgi:hypothetical protein
MGNAAVKVDFSRKGAKAQRNCQWVARQPDQAGEDELVHRAPSLHNLNQRLLGLIYTLLIDLD